MKTRLAMGLAGLLLVFYLLPPAEVAVPEEKFHWAMGTVVRLALYVDGDSAEAFFDLATGEIDRIDSLMSRYSPTSELSRLNRLASTRVVTCSPDLAHVLERSLRLARVTGGAFDITVGPLTRLWGFPDPVSVPPTATRIDSALALVGHTLVEMDGLRVRFTEPGVRLDLGAAAKGYAVDRAVAVLVEAGVDAGLVEAGGDLRFWGAKPDGRAWQFAVQHPRRPNDLIVVDDPGDGLMALATSGDYEQVFEFEGRAYHHLLDPQSGYPARRAVSATVWAASAMDADILATAAFVMGPQSAIELAESLPDTEALVFFMDGDLLRRQASAGLAGQLREVSGTTD